MGICLCVRLCGPLRSRLAFGSEGVRPAPAPFPLACPAGMPGRRAGQGWRQALTQAPAPESRRNLHVRAAPRGVLSSWRWVRGREGIVPPRSERGRGPWEVVSLRAGREGKVGTFRHERALERPGITCCVTLLASVAALPRKARQEAGL